jgi:hypothetical protein
MEHIWTKKKIEVVETGSPFDIANRILTNGGLAPKIFTCKQCGTSIDLTLIPIEKVVRKLTSKDCYK